MSVCVRVLDILKVHLLVLHNTYTISFPLFSSRFLRYNKLGRDVVKTLIISDNQAFYGLIIKPFDNQTVSSP